jgi:predicted Rossmann-fold nucleotide-binding protein
MDEFFELLTLIQTGKIKKKLLLVVYDKQYWSSIINFDGLVERGVISKADLNLFSFCNTIDETFNLITTHFKKNYLDKETEGTEPSLNLK